MLFKFFCFDVWPSEPGGTNSFPLSQLDCGWGTEEKTEVLIAKHCIAFVYSFCRETTRLLWFRAGALLSEPWVLTFVGRAEWGRAASFGIYSWPPGCLCHCLGCAAWCFGFLKAEMQAAWQRLLKTVRAAQGKWGNSIPVGRACVSSLVQFSYWAIFVLESCINL